MLRRGCIVGSVVVAGYAMLVLAHFFGITGTDQIGANDVVKVIAVLVMAFIVCDVLVTACVGKEANDD